MPPDNHDSAPVVEPFPRLPVIGALLSGKGDAMPDDTNRRNPRDPRLRAPREQAATPRFGATDLALLAVIALLLFWLQWLMGVTAP